MLFYNAFLPQPLSLILNTLLFFSLALVGETKELELIDFNDLFIESPVYGIDQEGDPVERKHEAFLAQEYINLHRSKTQHQAQETFKHFCAATHQPKAHTGAWCDLIESEQTTSPKKARLRLRFSPAVIATWVQKAQFSTLDFTLSEELLNGLKKINKPETLDLLVSALLQNKEPCHSHHLYYLTGLKLEEFLPDDLRFKQILDLYEKATLCPAKMDKDQQEAIIKARFRAGLFHIALHQYAKALTHLQLLIDQKATDLQSRATYWAHFCATQLKDLNLKKSFKDKLLKEMPLSYHALALDQNLETLFPTQAAQSQLKISRRSVIQPQLNGVVRVMEWMNKFEFFELGVQAYRTIETQMLESEPEFRLYVAFLLAETGQFLPKFKLLSDLFQQNPQLLHPANLELYFPLKHFQPILTHSHSRGIDPFFITALIRQESAFAAHARSPAGAVGLMQVLPSTARRISKINRKTVMDVDTNVKIGVRYIESLLKKYGGDVELAMAAYNAGASKVDKWLKRYPTDNRMLFLDLIPYKETRNYVAVITRNYFWYKKIYETRISEQGKIKGTWSAENSKKPMVEKAPKMNPLTRGLAALTQKANQLFFRALKPKY